MTIASRASTPHTVLLLSDARCRRPCDPQLGETACAYRVAWSINPHMRIGAGDAVRATDQLDAFAETLALAGASVHRVPFVHGAHDSVFVKDNAVVIERPSGERAALLARFRHEERAREPVARRNALARLGIERMTVSRAYLEGGDVVVLPGARGAVLGTGFRSSPAAADELAAFLDAAVTTVRLVDPRLYHLDMVLSVLTDGTALVCPEAIAPEDLARLEDTGLLARAIRVPLEEALAFGANVVEVEGTVVLAADAPQVTRALRDRGYGVIGCDLREFHLAGGSAACLVSRVHLQADVAAERQRVSMFNATAAMRSTAA